MKTHNSASARVSAKGWIVIPVAMRRRYHIEPGQQIWIVDYGGVLSLVPAKRNPVSEGRGLLVGKRSLTRALLEDRQRERKGEEH
jgi:bifunctional DNA-binding transcriptional regulator/antitoxin component of YhaV-PrlF toxin-antitoxin module